MLVSACNAHNGKPGARESVDKEELRKWAIVGWGGDGVVVSPASSFHGLVTVQCIYSDTPVF